MEGPGGGTIRAFLALPLSAPQREEIAGKLVPLLGAREPVRWVGPENLHVTLRFFGDVGQDGRRRIEERVESAARGTGAFSFRLGPCGAFPDLRGARVLWVGLSGGDEAVGALAARIEELIAGLGFPVEKRFHAHITVGRTKGALSPGFPDRFAGLSIEPVEERATAIRLMKSDLTPAGARYAVVREFSLAP